jgi:hypothetical protein
MGVPRFPFPWREQPVVQERAATKYDYKLALKPFIFNDRRRVFGIEEKCCKCFKFLL